MLEIGGHRGGLVLPVVVKTCVVDPFRDVVEGGLVEGVRARLAVSGSFDPI